MPDLSRTKLCKTLVATGRCENPSCTFAHSRAELRDDLVVHRARLRAPARVPTASGWCGGKRGGVVQQASAARAPPPGDWSVAGAAGAGDELALAYAALALDVGPPGVFVGHDGSHVAPWGLGGAAPIPLSVDAFAAMGVWGAASLESAPSEVQQPFAQAVRDDVSDDSSETAGASLRSTSASSGPSSSAPLGCKAAVVADAFSPLKLVRSAEGALCAMSDAPAPTAMRVRSAEGQLCAMDEC